MMRRQLDGWRQMRGARIRTVQVIVPVLEVTGRFVEARHGSSLLFRLPRMIRGWED